MTNLNYGTMLEDAFSTTKNNFLILFWTFFVFQLITIVLAAPFFYLLLTGEEPNTLLMVLMLVSILILIILSAFFNMMATGMLLHATNKKKLSIKSGFAYGKKYFWKYLAVIVLLILIMLALLIPLIFAIVLAIGSGSYIAQNPALGTTGLVFSIIFTITLIVVMIAFMVSQIFIAPKTIVEEAKGSFQLIKESVAHLKKAPGHVLATAGLVLVLGIGLGLFSLLFDLPFLLNGISIATIAIETPLVITLFILAYLAKIIIQTIASIYFSAFIVHSYQEFFKKDVDKFKWLK